MYKQKIVFFLSILATASFFFGIVQKTFALCGLLAEPGSGETVVTVGTLGELQTEIDNAAGPKTIYLESGTYNVTSSSFVNVYNPDITIRSVSVNRDDAVSGDFIDIDAGDLHLASNSVSAVNAGTPIADRTDDIDEQAGYETAEKKIEIFKGKEETVNFQLTSVQYALTIKTIPENAGVTIKNSKTAYKDRVSLPPGCYDIEVTSEGYKTYREWIKLEKEDKTIP